jgi:hypothetical protein
MQMLGCIAVLYGERHAVGGGEQPGAQPLCYLPARPVCRARKQADAPSPRVDDLSEGRPIDRTACLRNAEVQNHLI